MKKRKPYQSVRWAKPVRVKYVTDRSHPSVVSALVKYYDNIVEGLGTNKIHYSVYALARSLNHMYSRSVVKGKVHTWKKKSVDDFDLLTLEALGLERFKFKPTGPLAVIICLESKLWVTQTHQVRQMDADNRVKVVVDALEKAIETPDELCWHFHVFKVPSKMTRTTVWVYDLGEIVEFYS